MAAEDKINNTVDDLAGKAKEFGGKLTGDDQLKAEGQADQVQAQVQDKVDDAKQAVADGADKVKDTIAGVTDSFKKN